MKLRPTLHTVKKEATLNSRRADFSPALFGDDWDQLYWTTTRPQASGDELSGITGTKYADIFFSKKDDKGKWSAPEAVEGELNLTPETVEQAFSSDALNMILTNDGQAVVTWTDAAQSMAYALTGPQADMAEVYSRLIPLADWDAWQP